MVTRIAYNDVCDTPGGPGVAKEYVNVGTDGRIVTALSDSVRRMRLVVHGQNQFCQPEDSDNFVIIVNGRYSKLVAYNPETLERRNEQ